jgi:hypothetical protein
MSKEIVCEKCLTDRLKEALDPRFDEILERLDELEGKKPAEDYDSLFDEEKDILGEEVDEEEEPANDEDSLDDEDFESEEEIKEEEAEDEEETPKTVYEREQALLKKERDKVRQVNNDVRRIEGAKDRVLKGEQNAVRVSKDTMNALGGASKDVVRKSEKAREIAEADKGFDAPRKIKEMFAGAKEFDEEDADEDLDEKDFG